MMTPFFYLFILYPLNDCYLIGCKRGFRVYLKNPDLERKKLNQKRSKTLKRVLGPLSDKLDRQISSLLERHQNEQISTFGTRLSQVPGDGGEIPKLDDAVDKVQCVKNYFRFISKCDAEHENFKLYSSDEDTYARLIAENPTRTFGAFQDREPILNKVFYKPLPPFTSDVAYEDVIDRKVKKKSKVVLDRIAKSTRGYRGILAELIFDQLSKEELDDLRAMEIEVKQAKITPDNPILKKRLGSEDPKMIMKKPVAGN